jgi:hypothetical protein
MPFVLLFALSALAAPVRVPVQGALTDPSGAPSTGTHTLSFELSADANGGGLIHAESQQSALDGGAFSVVLGGAGDLEDAELAATSTAWLRVRMDGGAWSERVQIGAVPYAAWAAYAGLAAEATHAESASDADHATQADDATNAVNAQFADHATQADDATNAGYATNAGNAATADEALHATSATEATTALSADDADNLAGYPGADYVRWADAAFTAALASAGSVTTQEVLDALSGGSGTTTLPGGVKVGNAGTCSGSADYGTIRWTGTAFEGCTASGWGALGVSAPAAPFGGGAGSGSGDSSANAGESCATIKAAFPSSSDSGYWIKPRPTDTPFRVYCDMTTDGGGWTMVAKLLGSSPVMNRSNTAQWRNRTWLGSIDNINAENALGPSYDSVAFRDVLIRSTATNKRFLAWRHPSTMASVFAVVDAGGRVSDGVRIGGSVQNLDYDAYPDNQYHDPCSGLKYGFLGFDYTYTQGGPIAGHNLVHGHIGGIVAASIFRNNGGVTADVDLYCLSDFGFGGGYYDLATEVNKENIQAHWWGTSNTNSADFRSHAMFVRNPVGESAWGTGNLSGSSMVNAGLTCKDIKTRFPTSASGSYWLKPTTNARPFQAYCDMTTDGGGWTLVAKMRGNTSNLNRTSTEAWRRNEYIGDISNLAVEDAFGPSYTHVPFTDVMMQALSDPNKRLGWRHPSTFTSMFSIVDAGNRVDNGVRLFGTIGGLDYTGTLANHNECVGLKFGFLTFDFTYASTTLAGHSLQTGHTGAVVGASIFQNSGGGSGNFNNCITDFGMGGGYVDLAAGPNRYNMQAHRWGVGNSVTADFNPHALFIR